MFINNTADYGGAIYSHTSFITFKDNSYTVFSNNTAGTDGGAIHCKFIIRSLDLESIAMQIYRSKPSFEPLFTKIFDNNIVKHYGGPLSYTFTTIYFKANSTTEFNNNLARSGGAISGHFRGSISFEGSSATIFNNNTANVLGGAISTVDYCDVIFSDNSTVIFANNNAALATTVHSNNSIIAIGNPTVIFNDHLVKWCNNTCLPYRRYGVKIDSNGVVWCSNQKAFICSGENCYCKILENLLDNLTSNITVNITNNVTLSSVITLRDLKNISIIGHNNITVICGVNGGGLLLRSCDKILVEGFTWIGCGSSGTNNRNNLKPAIKFLYSSDITIQNCTFQYSIGQVILLSNIHKDVNINHCKFMNNNRHRGKGAVIHCTNCYYESKSILTINISNCNFSYNGYSKRTSVIYFGSSSNAYFTHIHLHSSNYQNNKGTSIYLSDYNYILHINGEVLFENNVAEHGAGIYISYNSTIAFDENSNANFMNNSVSHKGVAIFLGRYSSVTFEQSSTVKFNDNKAKSGTIYSTSYSNVIFKGNCQVTFIGSSVTQYGSAIFSTDNSHVIFTGHAKVAFMNNVVSSNDIDSQYGGTIYSVNNGYVGFEENSSVAFNNNIANIGTTIVSLSNSSISFTDQSKVMFNNNIAQSCGVLTSALGSSIIFNDNTEVTFNNNTVYNYFESAAAGAMCTSQTDIMFSGYSVVKFTNNTADRGGAMVFSDNNVIIEEYSRVIFNNNIAQYSFGAALTCYNNSNVTFTGNSNVFFIGNKVNQDGGAVYLYNMCKITSTDSSTLTFLNNSARNNGGAIFAQDNSSITIKGNSVLSFINNEALQNGGAGYLNDHCNFIIEETATVTFIGNKASHGGAICISEKTKLMFKGNSTTLFNNNLAIVSGGAIQVSINSSIALKDYINFTFTNNNADYGSAIFLDATATMVNSGDKSSVKFMNNIGRILGSPVYQDIAELCSTSCVDDKVVGISNEHISTPPNELKFSYPAICIDNDNDTQCNSYLVQKVMLGEGIVIPACVLDYYNQSIDSAQFLIHSVMNPNYLISGPKHVVISDKFEGITIMANQTILKTSTNFSISITLNTALYSNWKQISVNLTIELSPCPPGFWQQFSHSEKCKCYTEKDIVSCSDSNSTIKGGYWFGSVAGKPTVSICPINYCNFTCCETSNGYYHLSPVRDNQCRSHRSGAACGSCTDGYTLTFDSTKCVNINNCTAGHTVLVILLSIIYWIVMVTSVFAIMYYKVGIGYLYGITYYYSIVDILLNQNLYVNRGLYLTVSIMSSFSKITPRLLGDLCFTPGMSGIDQQFIHYIHPSAVLIILGIISLSARISQKISLFISRGIIHVICLLLLLSYTSIASTSLLLIRPLTFQRIDKVYTYLSPDIGYFHGRHAAYGIVALLCIISIVTGLPLLLTLEPFINHKFNFTKIKPLLDQFQGCYKDKYRCFAGYYMICRLVIITIVIANVSNDFAANYTLIVVCVITELIHVMVKPYNKELLNKLDAIILRLIILIAALSLSDDFDSPFVITIAVMLVISPLLILITITLFLHKHNLRKMIKHIERFVFKDKAPNNNDVNKNEMPVREFNLVVDDSMRENNTIFDV